MMTENGPLRSRSRKPSETHTPQASSTAESLKKELFGTDLSVEDVAYVLDLDKSTVLRYLREGRLFGFQIGREWRIPESALRDYKTKIIEERTHTIRRAEAERRVDEKLARVNDPAVEPPKWAKIWCLECGTAQFGSYGEDGSTGEAWYSTRCNYCGVTVVQTYKSQPQGKQATKPIPLEEDESDMPF
jgi:excisionase family DNA binding protein